MTTFDISADLVERIFEHARKEAPLEACGMIGGRRAQAEKVYQAKNVDTSRTTYCIDPKEAFQIIRKMRAAKIDFIASYHSHPETEGRPSPTDIAKAGNNDMVHVIVSLRDSTIRAFKIKSQTVSELDVRVFGDRD